MIVIITGTQVLCSECFAGVESCALGGGSGVLMCIKRNLVEPALNAACICFERKHSFAVWGQMVRPHIIEVQHLLMLFVTYFNLSCLYLLQLQLIMFT